MTTFDDIDLSAGLYVKGMPLDDRTFLAVTDFRTLRSITRDPALLQPGNTRAAAADPDLEQEQSLHELVQRALAGAKKTNVEKYAQYILALVAGESVGVLPPMHLWSQDPLSIVDQTRNRYLLIPIGQRLLAIDGETQLSAHWRLDSADGGLTDDLRRRHREHPLAVIVHHGVPIKDARQYFHDLNVLSVRPNTSLSIGMDTQDPIVQIVDDVEAAVPVLTGRVERMARQLSRRSSKVVTLQNLRQFVVDIAKGISGIQYGAKPAPLGEQDVEDLREVAINWAKAFFGAFAEEIADRDTYLASTGPILAAVGAMGRDVLEAPLDQRPERMEALTNDLRAVNWAKGPHWEGIAGGVTARGVFSVKGTKEVAYAVHAALVDPRTASYDKVRSTTTSSSDASTHPGAS